MKPVLIIRTGRAPESIRGRHGDFPHWFRLGSRLLPEQLRVIDVAAGESLPPPRDVAGAMITGSAAMVTERAPWSERTAGWIRDAMDMALPLFGVCYGHQLMAHALGGRVDYLPGGREIGTQPIELLDHAVHDPLTAPLPATFRAHTTHEQSVLEPPPQSVVLARSARDPHQLLRHGPCAVSTQFHPASMHLKSVKTRSGVLADQALQWAAGLAEQSLHPVSRTLATAALTKASVADVKEFAGLGLQGWLAESSEDVTGPLRLGSNLFCQVDAGADPGRCVFLADKRGWIATFELAEALRPDAAKTVAALQAQGLAVYMMSGDTQIAAQGVADQLDISNGKNNVVGDCTPETKLALLQALQTRGSKVLMVGDGLNDGPTLAAAHVSVAIGASVPLAQAQSDFVIPGAQLLMLPVMLGQAKRTLRIVKQNLAWAAVYNVICVPLALAGWLPAWLAGLGMATSSLLVMANAARLSKFKASK